MWFLLFSLFLMGSTVEGKDYTLIITTASSFMSGTDARVKIAVRGTQGSIEDKIIRGEFDVGSTDTIKFTEKDIGYVTGMAIHRDNSGFLPNWKLDKIVIKVPGAADSIFNHYDWVKANAWTSLTLSCRPGSHLTEQRYCSGPLMRIFVKTAAGFNSGTDAKIKIRVQGTKGSMREREIKGQFEKGITDRIEIQDYPIGYVTGMEIYRNNDGLFPDWKLDQVVIKIPGAADSIFNYYSWVPANRWISLTLSCPSGYRLNEQHYCSE